MEVSSLMAKALANDTGRSVETAERMSDEHAQERVGSAQRAKLISETPIEDWIVQPTRESEEKLLQIGREFGRIFGVNNVLLAKRDAPFSGLFSGRDVLLNQSLADGLSSAGGFCLTAAAVSRQ